MQLYYTAPPSKQVAFEMERFVNWYNGNGSSEEGITGEEALLLGVVKAAIAHLWFEVIHPFDDGNGRIGRVIAEHALAQSVGHPIAISLSSMLEKNRKQYYQMLHDSSLAEMNITPWIEWFVEQVFNAQDEASKRIDYIAKKARFWMVHEEILINERQQKVLKKYFDFGPGGFPDGISAKKYQSIAGCSKATATRDLTDLLSKTVVKKLEGYGRNTRYIPNV